MFCHTDEVRISRISKSLISLRSLPTVEMTKTFIICYIYLLFNTLKKIIQQIQKCIKSRLGQAKRPVKRIYTPAFEVFTANWAYVYA